MVYIKRHTVPSEFMIEGWSKNFDLEKAMEFLNGPAQDGIEVTEINEATSTPLRTKLKLMVEDGFTLQGKVVGSSPQPNDPSSYKYLPGNTGMALDTRLHKSLKKDWVIPIWQLQEVRYNSTISPNFTQYRDTHENEFNFPPGHPKEGKPDIFAEAQRS